MTCVLFVYFLFTLYFCILLMFVSAPTILLLFFYLFSSISPAQIRTLVRALGYFPSLTCAALYSFSVSCAGFYCLFPSVFGRRLFCLLSQSVSMSFSTIQARYFFLEMLVALLPHSGPFTVKLCSDVLGFHRVIV